MFQVRPEKHADHAAIHALNEAAFDRGGEAELVDRLREEARPVVSLVAEDRGEIIGHVLFSPVKLEGGDALRPMALGPMAVRRERRGRGVGSELVLQGLAACERLGCRAAFVLGHPTYYRRFGFRPAAAFGIDSEYADAGEAFMAREIEHGALDGIHGTVRYHEAFAAVTG